MESKALISFTVTAKLICVFVFAYADCWFSHEAAQVVTSLIGLLVVQLTSLQVGYESLGQAELPSFDCKARFLIASLNLKYQKMNYFIF